MKGLAVWMWLIGGIIVGMIMFVLFFQLMGYLTLARSREDAKQSFEELTGTINAMCESKAGIQTSKRFVFPDSVSIVYSTSDPKVFSEKNNRTYGIFACLKFQKEQFCEKTRCDLEFHPLRNKENVLGLVDTLLGRSSYQEHQVKLTKTECGISVLNTGESPSATCGPCQTLPLIKCRNSVIFGLASPQVLIMTDMARIKDCCLEDNKIIKLLGNAASYFKGKNILLIWELDLYDPSLETRLPLVNSLSGLGFTVKTLRHTAKLESADLKIYDQLWLFRPGWCSQVIKGCEQTIPWSDSEINAIGEFVKNGGKIFLFTDTSGGKVEDQAVVNKILQISNANAVVDGTTVCGLGTETITTSDISDSPMTNGLKTFDVTAATRITC